MYDIGVVNEREHSPRVTVNDECFVELVGSFRSLFHCHRWIWFTELWWGFVLVAKVFTSCVDGCFTGWGSQTGSRCHDSDGEKA